MADEDVAAYASHVEAKNAQLFKIVSSLKQSNERYRDALREIKESCVGCQAYFIAYDALGEDETDDHRSF